MTGRLPTFRIVLPASARSSTTPKPERTERRSPKRLGMVLVVDDEPSVRHVTRAGLEHAGLAVVTAKNGHEAVRSYLEHRDHLGAILLDMEMPGLGGTATYRELERLGATLPVLFMSGYSRDPSLENVSRTANIDFLQKPFSVDALLESLEKIGN